MLLQRIPCATLKLLVLFFSFFLDSSQIVIKFCSFEEKNSIYFRRREACRHLCCRWLHARAAARQSHAWNAWFCAALGLDRSCCLASGSLLLLTACQKLLLHSTAAMNLHNLKQGERIWWCQFGLDINIV